MRLAYIGLERTGTRENETSGITTNMVPPPQHHRVISGAYNFIHVVLMVFLSQVLLIFGVLLPATKQKEMAFVRFYKNVLKSPRNTCLIS